MTKREQRVVNAFLNCIKNGEYTEDYAITLIEDKARFGWMSYQAIETFYDELDKMSEPVVEPEPIVEEPIEEIPVVDASDIAEGTTEQTENLPEEETTEEPVVEETPVNTEEVTEETAE